jgi:endonuclease/exonuclease/phosphatase family metal-dependent hydrolase
VTWNIQTARPNPDGPADTGAVVEALAPLLADVCALQELDRDRRRSGRADQPAQLAEGLGGRLVWAPTVRWGRGEYGIALVVRGEVRATEVVHLSGTREPRALLVVETDVAGQRWTVGCSHLSRNRAFARQQLVRAFDALAAHPRPRVLMGDLNLVPDEVLPWSTAEGYQLVTGPPTHSTRQRRVTRRIDHVLVAGATATATAVHDFAVSDHRAVVADLEAG